MKVTLQDLIYYVGTPSIGVSRGSAHHLYVDLCIPMDGKLVLTPLSEANIPYIIAADKVWPYKVCPEVERVYASDTPEALYNMLNVLAEPDMHKMKQSQLEKRMDKFRRLFYELDDTPCGYYNKRDSKGRFCK